ncbi:putative iron-sulfur binding protein [Marinobacterium lacunae]|uniref:Putative iron-sulfur binding protein n=1 Tax=Marinobacterium lacunae TaxID=1232683 RepID=A0A081FXC1_9GAMM|nr:pyridoxamine 5'-phosphate oxidase family protein [Marinobacterium lacunae]KEA63176.1 putative iron-sulfur binding protein [Marinobacterium lacunae]
MQTQPFHAGEREVQTRVGVADKMAAVGEKVLRPYLIEQHRAFYAHLPMLLVASADCRDRLWATALYGEPGFVASPDERTLSVKLSLSASDPLFMQFTKGQRYAVLGLEFSSRRRNRANGRVIAASADELVLEVEQSFGNCPKYIVPREICAHSPVDAVQPEAISSLLGPVAELISEADTLFIASRAAPAVGSLTEPMAGYDISHRGGVVGFVHQLDTHTLAFADFRGNNFFNTLGNIMTDTETALLFIDYQSGDHLHLNGEASLLWADDGPLPVAGYARNVLFRMKSGYWVKQASPYRWANTGGGQGDTPA